MEMIAKFYQVSERQLSEFLGRLSLAYDYTVTPFYDDVAAIKMAEEMLSEMRTKMAGFPRALLPNWNRLQACCSGRKARRKDRNL